MAQEKEIENWLQSSKVFHQFTNKLNKSTEFIESRNQKLLFKLQKVERKLATEIAKGDKKLATILFSQTDSFYTALRKKQDFDTTKNLAVNNLYFDTVLAAAKAVLPTSKEISSSLAKSFTNSQEIKKQLSSRLQQLRLSYPVNISKKYLQEFNAVFQSYQQQLKQLKEQVCSPNFLARQITDELKKQPTFRKFLEQQKQLRQMLPLQAVNVPISNALAGTRFANSQQVFNQAVQQLQQQLAQQQMLSVDGFNLQELFKAKGQLQRYRSAVGSQTPLNQLGSFKKRIEKGITIESQRANNFLPSMSNIALILGYKITNWATVGIGFSCKVGWGQPVKDINVTMQGLGARVYGEAQWKKSIWLIASLERNHFLSLSDLQFNNITPTQYSALVGLAKKMRVGKKTQSIQLLWDALAYKQIPRAEPLKFRINYQF